MNVQVLKDRCGVRDHNVSSLFRREVGASIKAYIESLRMEAARDWLLTSDVSIYDISHRLGYDHPQTFYRVFRRYFGCTPGDVRGRRDA